MNVVAKIIESSACAGALAFAVSACASAPPAEAVSTTATRAAQADATYARYVAPRAAKGRCSLGLPTEIDFTPRTAELPADAAPVVDTWARCLNLPELEHTTIVLLGGDGPDTPAGLFVQRAQLLRDALVARGVARDRMVIGAANASRDGGPYVTRDGVRLETTTVTTIRAFPRQNARYGVR